MIRINLIYDRKALEVRKVAQELILALFVTIAVFMLIGFVWNMQAIKLVDVNKKLAISKAKKNKLNKVKTTIDSFEAIKKNLDARINAINLLVSLKKGPARIFDELNYLLPDELWLQSITENGGSLTLKGFSFTNPGIANLMNNIKQSPFFSRVDLVEIKKNTKAQGITNNFTMTIGIHNTTDSTPKVLTREKEKTASALKGSLFGKGGLVEQAFARKAENDKGKKLSKDLQASP